jgi:hypothetical protein
MERSVVILAVAVGGAAILGASSPARSAREAEVARLERHFDSVDVELRSRDVSRMSVSQKSNRATLVSWLRDYRNADLFPKNDRFAKPTPFFRDKDGVLCAMAYLIDRSGRSDIVNKVAATRNNAYIAELVDDPKLVAWLDEWGLSAQEAARIQPSYGGGGIPDDPADEDVVESDFALASIGLGAASVGTTTWNILKPSYLSGFLGVIAGTASIITGANYLDDDEYGDGSKPVASVVIGLGAVSLGAGIYGILEARHERERDIYRGGRRRRFDLRIMPDVSLRQEKPVAGLLVHGRF